MSFQIITIFASFFFFLNTAILQSQDKEIDNSLSINLTKNSHRLISFNKKNNDSKVVKKEFITFDKEGKYEVNLSFEFVLKDFDDFVSFNINTPEYIQNFTLNGVEIIKPLAGMIYKSIPAIPKKLLKNGKNELIASWTQRVISLKKAEEKRKANRRIRKTTIVAPGDLKASDLDISMQGIKPAFFTFQTKPVLGHIGYDYFTVTGRVNIPAKVTLEIDGKEYKSLNSENSFIHSFKINNLKPDTKYSYSLKGILIHKDKEFKINTETYIVKTLPKSDNFKFAMLGDSRSYPEDWARVSKATTKEEPALAIFAGDMVNNGKLDNQWDEEFFAPAEEFLATIPFYAIIGNHEKNCSLFPEMFVTPNGTNNWYQEVNQVLFIGIDGAAKNEKDNGKLLVWLEELLSNSEAKFIFLTSHYPAWSSGYHGNLGYKERGEDVTKPRERGARFARYSMMPLLKKYNVTAMFAGHDHYYERSEPNNSEGITMIITGGAGAPLYEKEENSEIQNPYSKVFESKHHYCILTVTDNTCSMKVKTPEGEIIDQRVWEARK